MSTRVLPDLAVVRAGLLELGYSGPNAVVDVQREYGLEPTNALDRNTILIIVDLQEARRIGQGAGHAAPNRAVKGLVSTSFGEAAPGLEVQLVASKFRGETILATGKTETTGRYELPFAKTDSSDPLFVRILDSATVVATSPAQTTKTPLLVVDVIVDPIHVHAPTEYERLRADVLAKIGKVDLASLKEDATSHDISFLASATSWTSDQLVALVIAARLAASSKVDGAIFYALLREGAVLGISPLQPRLDVNLATAIQPLFYDIVLTDPTVVRKAVADAVAGRIVPATVLSELDSTLATFAKSNAAAQAYSLTEQPQQVLSTVSANIAAGTHTQILNVLSGGGVGDPGQLLSSLQTVSFAAGDAPQRAALAQILASRPDLVGVVQSLAGNVSPATPAPTATLTFKTALAATKPVAAQATLLQVLEANPNVDLATANLTTLATPHLAKAADSASQLQQLKAVQRVFKVAPSYRQTAALLGAGIHSAAQISSLGETQFVARFSKDGTFTADEARTAFYRAHDIHIATGLIASELRGVGGAMSTAATAPKAIAEKLAKVSQSNPNLKSLFSLTDLCECDECRSIDGPAAYLVDVLQFVKNRMVVDTTVSPPVATKTAQQVLFARRPDLGDIDLTCDNAMVPMPYIDVVCELLEQAVAPDLGFVYGGALVAGIAPATLVSALQAHSLPFTAAAFVQEADASGNFYVRDSKGVCKLVPAGAPNTWSVLQLRQTFGTADELAAAPAYVNNTAYQTLQASQIAFHLPFDLPHEESRAYFEQFGVGRDVLMRALVVAGVPAPRDIAAEQLDLSDIERALIVTADPAHQNVYWNTGATDPTTVVNVVDTFLTRTEMQYADLQVLLARAYINPDNKLFIQHLDSSCNTAQQLIANLDGNALDRIHRFLRLQHRLGWSMPTLDHAIEAARLGNGAITDELLVRLADLSRLQARSNVSLDDLIIYYGTIPTETPADGGPSRYAQIFLNPSANGPVDPALTVAAVTTNQGPPIPAVQTQLGDVAATLALTLGAKSADVAQLIAARGAATILDFDNLAALFSQLSLARALGLSVSDYLLLGTLSGRDPLTSPSTALDFADANDAVRTAGMKLVDLQFLLAFVASDVSVRALSDAAVATVLGEIQAALQSAFTANRSPFDPSLSADENESSLGAVVGRLPNVTPTQLSSLQQIVERTYADPVVTAPAFLDQLLGSVVDTVPIKALLVTLTGLAPAQTAAIEAARLALIQGIVDPVAEYLYQQARVALVPSTLASALHTDGDLATSIVGHAHLTGQTLLDLLGADSLIDKLHVPPVPPAITAATFTSQYAALRLFGQIALAAAMLPFASSDLEWLLDRAPALGWMQLDLLPYQAAMPATSWALWGSLQDAVGLFGRYPAVVNPADATQPFTLQTVFDLVLAPGTAVAQVLDRLALVTGWDRATLGDLDTRFGFSAVDLTPYRSPATLLRLETAIIAVRMLGASVAGAVAWIKPQLVAADALALRLALKPRYGNADWLSVLKQIYDPLRQEKRDALVAYLLALNPVMESSDDLFDYFMIDIEMCSCAPTSRIVSAHGTLQLFVQRCLLGVEPTAVADVAVDSGWDQWSWMSAYRVWQANREVFLYPENWIDPPLRDDKSEIYEDMENALAQTDLSEDAISDAAIGYLEALDDVAFLEVMSMYYEESTLTMHVFARTKGGDPHTYYYRQFVQERTWTPWQKVNVDIKGDHLIAFIRNGRVNIAWPIFSEQANQDQDTSIPDSTPGTKVAKTQKAWQIQLAISELANGVWLPSKTSKESLAWTPWPGFYEQLPIKDYFRFIPIDLRGAGFSIACSFVDNGKRTSDDTPGSAIYFIGGFTLTGCKGYPEPYTRDSANLLFLPRFLNTDVEDLRFVETSGNELAIETIALMKFVEILARTPNAFKVTYPQQISLIDYIILLWELVVRANATKTFATLARDQPIAIPLGTFMPYFYEDSVHNYVIIPGYFSGRDRTNGALPIQRTFSDVLTLVEDVVALAKAYLLEYEEDPNHDLAALVAKLVNDADFLNIIAELKIYTGLTYGIEFANFYHPLVCSLRKTMYGEGIGKLMDRATQLQVTSFEFDTSFAPLPIVRTPHPIEDIDFLQSGSYSSYNWELFFHLPLAIAVQLTGDQQFERAMDWFHYIFNPTDATSEPVPQKYWQTKPFYQTTTADYVSQRIDTIMNGIASDPSGLSIDQLRFAVQDWRENPFEPFRVARSRTVAFQQAVLMKYVDNLIAWGDSLFTQDTMETVNQATQMYVLADKLLGPRPRTVPPLVTPPPETYNQLEAKVDLFGNALLDLENLIPDLGLLPHGGDELPPPPLTLSSLYFCIPPNPNLDAYWDKVADRLFKLRHCQDINGVERTLALFAPPIDPGALIAARAAGLSIAEILAGMNSPLPLYRFTAMQTKATELVHIVTQLGSSMLQALEKRDVEALARLRSTQEIDLLNAVKLVKQRHIDEAQVQIDIFQKSIDLTMAKSQYYHSRQYMNTGETVAMGLTVGVLVTEAIAMGLDIGAAITHMLPTFNIGIAGFGGSPSFSVSWGSENIAGAESGFAQVSRDVGSMLQTGAQLASTLGGFDRRQDEWTFQAQLADLELIQLHRQQDAATIRLDIAQKELSAHQIQIDNAKKTDQFLKSKFTNTELFDYMVGQLSGVFYRGYQLGLDVAHKAERCFQFELGVETTFIQYNYWDGLKKGLLSGERLLGDIKQMDAAYMQQNKREYELTKHVSLAQLDPLALLQLKSSGACTFSIPEASFDLDHPGHYFRRLKTVSLTIPCVTGPYTSVSAKLSMVGNRYRKSTGGGGYPESPGNDTRFSYNVTAIQSVATSQGDNDNGLFELNFHDERYLPFEYAGAISSWRLELPQGFPQFDYNAISDVVLRLRYTSRDGGSGFRSTVEGQLRAEMNAMIVDATNTGLFQGIDVRRQFPDAWYQLVQTGTTTITITPDFLPFFAQQHGPAIDTVSWIARLTGNPASTKMSLDGAPPFTLSSSTSFGGRCKGDSSLITLGTPFVVTATDFTKLQELAFVIHYTLGH